MHSVHSFAPKISKLVCIHRKKWVEGDVEELFGPATAPETATKTALFPFLGYQTL
jgi:TctA family transporter